MSRFAPEDRCDVCKFFDSNRCHRHAPIAYPHVYPPGNYHPTEAMTEIRKGWPPVSSYDWCGDFERSQDGMRELKPKDAAPGSQP